MVGHAPVHLTLYVGDGIEVVNNVLAAVLELSVGLIVPVVVQREEHPVIGAGTLDGRVEHPERLLVGLHVVGNVRGSHMVPLLVVDLIADNPVGNLAAVGIGPAVALCQEGRDGSGLLKSRLSLNIGHIVKYIGFLSGARYNQVRSGRIPSV